MWVAIVAQGFSLFQSVFMSFVVAKILDNNIFAWWQWFLYLAGLTHYIHVGVGEGNLLRYGGTEYNNLPFPILSGVLRIYAISQVFFSFLISIFAMSTYGFSNESVCVCLAAAYMIAANIAFLLAQILIATNRTNIYSLAVIFNKLLVLVVSIILLCCGYRNYIGFAIGYCIGQYIELFLCAIKCPEIILQKLNNFKYIFKEILDDIKVGFILSLSTLCANMVTNVGRLCIKISGSLLSFGSLSLANSLSNFFLMFIRQIGTVIFPFLRRLGRNEQKEIFMTSKNLLSIFTTGILIGYYPVRLLVYYWLPNYQDSLIYLGYIMPIVVFDSQMSAINTPYLNSLNKEKSLLVINAIAFSITFVLSLFSIIVLDSIIAVSLSMTMGMLIKHTVGTFCVGRCFFIPLKKLFKEQISELVLMMIFIITASSFSILGMIVYLFAYLFYIVSKRSYLPEIKFILTRLPKK